MKGRLVLVLFLIFACNEYPLEDKFISAVAAGDYTALVEGCGNQLVPGYTYCRKTEGDASGELIHFVAPISNCKKASCVEIKVFGIDGDLVYGNTIPKDKMRLSVSWEKLLKRSTFELSDRGFWPFICRVYWVDSDGNERLSVSEGEIRLRVLKKGYIALHEVENDPNFAWEAKTRNNETIKMTTGMRTYVSKRKK